MKPSVFNHIIRRRGRPQLLYNSRRQQLLELDATDAAIYGGLAVPITRNLMNLKDPAVERLLQKLHSLGFFIEDEVSEALEMEVLAENRRFDHRRLHLWIQATTRCEEDCLHCPYRDSAADIDPAVLENLAALVAREASVLSELKITWFGGEPTLNWEAVSRFLQNLRQCSQQAGFKFHWSIISNGRSQHLKTIAIDPERPQILWINLSTLDSSEFDAPSTVMLTDFPSWIQNELKLPPRTGLLFLPHRPDKNLCRNLYGLCRATPEYSDEEFEIMRQAIAKGYRLQNLPRSKILPCPAVDARSFIIDVRGNLYKCWQTFGQPQKGVPSLDDQLHPNFIRWLDWNPFRQYHCRNCNILPWCLGGCRAKSQDEECGLWRYSLREMLKLVALALTEAGPADLSPEAQS